jgi:hypothetical protein
MKGMASTGTRGRIPMVVVASPAVFNAVLAEMLHTKDAAASLFVLVTSEDDESHETGVSHWGLRLAVARFPFATWSSNTCEGPGTLCRCAWQFSPRCTGAPLANVAIVLPRSLFAMSS